MLRTKLRNKFLKNRSSENKINYVKQRNRCVSFLKKTKREYYSNLNLKNICDNKSFWKIVKLMLSKKIKSNEGIALIENDEIIKTEKGTAKVLNAFFSNIFQNLDIQQGRIRRFWKKEGGVLYVGHHSQTTKKILGFRWSKKSKITFFGETYLTIFSNVSIFICKERLPMKSYQFFKVQNRFYKKRQKKQSYSSQ